MIDRPVAAVPPKPRVRSWDRAVVVVLICSIVALLLSVDWVYDSLQRALSASQPLIAAHPFLGAVVFVLLAAISAVLAFFSSALLLPAAVFAWGNTVTLLSEKYYEGDALPFPAGGRDGAEFCRKG